MDINIEREYSVLGGLFQDIIADMKNDAPLWEDFICKATKLHSSLRAAVLSISAYLETFQKIADCATNARGATKDIGTALTRICLRHKAVETRMKTFTSAIMNCLVLPLQEKMEDWKKSLINLDKEHAKEFKKARVELKKKTTDTLRLQKKKTRKMQIHSSMQSHLNSTTDTELNKVLESSMAVVQEKCLSLEEIERKAVRAALLEERGRFCLFARFLKPVLDEEIAMLMELTHLQEVSDQLQRYATLPHQLPPASEQLLTDIKGSDSAHWPLSTPPSSPSLSLGSRKSSVCSINSLTSSSSGSGKNHPSPSGHAWSKSHLQMSALFSQNTQNNENALTKSSDSSTWSHLKESTIRSEIENLKTNYERHTISSTYEKGHQRPTLSVYTFQALDHDNNSYCISQPASPVSSSSSSSLCSASFQQSGKKQLLKNNHGNRPPVPNRCSSLERPSMQNKSDSLGSPRAKAKLPLPAHLAKELPSHPFQQPMYVNMHVLANLAATRAQEMNLSLPTSVAEATSVATACADDKTKQTENDGDETSFVSTFEASSESRIQVSQTDSKSTNPQIEDTSNVQPSAIVRRVSKQQTKSCISSRRISALKGGTFSTFSNQETDDHGGGNSEDTENLPPPPPFLLEGSSPNTSPTPQRSISVSETVRTLTELRHTPASPSLLRKITGQSHNASSAAMPHNAVLQITRSTVEHCNQDSSNSVSKSIEVNKQTSVQGCAGLKLSKKHSSEQQSNKYSKTNADFFKTLNAKLVQPPQLLNSANKSVNIRRIMGNRMRISDPLQVRDSLMDQIRRGTTLRKTSGPINDCSAPKIN